ncbi:MAG: hypothetical protein K2M79_04715 [Muribaculaceae bacterium]|nr:hypothetical protein [Muribaculaceae bacterium]
MTQQEQNFYYTPECNEEIRKPSNAISWLGFSFSLFVLILLWLIMLWIPAKGGSGFLLATGTGMVMIFLVIGIPVGFIGLVLSIVGVIKAANNGGKVWISTMGLIFTGLTILSLFVIPLLRSVSIREPAKVESPAISVEKQQDKGLIFLVDGYQLSCFDNREQTDTAPYTTRISYSLQLEKELEVWFKMHETTEDDPISLYVTDDTDYTQVSELMEALELLNRNKFTLRTVQKDKAE